MAPDREVPLGEVPLGEVPLGEVPLTEVPAPQDARARQPGSAPPAGNERFGPLALVRTRKDDGRALLLYGVAEPERT